jgi:type 1 glutamine amidotransferase
MMKKILLLFWALPLMVFAQTKICLVSASAEYGSHDSLAKLQEDLEKQGMTCFRAFGEDKGNGVPGLEKLAESDVLVLFTRRIVLPPEQMELVRKHVDAGKPVVGIRTASHGIQNWVPDVKAFDKEVLGGSYDGHYKNNEAAELTRAAGQEEHAVFKGVQPFGTDGKLYKNEKLAADVTVLMTAKNASGQSQPVAWTRKHAGGKVFYTSLGVQSDFTKPEFRKFLVNAVKWSVEG